MRKKLKRTFMYVLIILVSYLSIGYLFHLVIFPEKKPVLADYFKTGKTVHSNAENFSQTIVKYENGLVYCTSEVGAFAAGPPKHVHTDFDETFEVENGELTVWINGEIKKLHAGETLRVPKGTPHKPYNETGETIKVKGIITFPEKFAFSLFQIYGLMDKDPELFHSPRAMLQMAMFQQAGFDSYLVDGPPIFIQKTTAFLLTPFARLLGYKSYYKEFEATWK